MWIGFLPPLEAWKRQLISHKNNQKIQRKLKIEEEKKKKKKKTKKKKKKKKKNQKKKKKKKKKKKNPNSPGLHHIIV